MSTEDKELIEARLAAKRAIAGDFTTRTTMAQVNFEGRTWNPAIVPEGAAVTSEFMQGFAESISRLLAVREHLSDGGWKLTLNEDGTFMATWPATDFIDEYEDEDA